MCLVSLHTTSSKGTYFSKNPISNLNVSHWAIQKYNDNHLYSCCEHRCLHVVAMAMQTGYCMRYIRVIILMITTLPTFLGLSDRLGDL